MGATMTDLSGRTRSLPLWAQEIVALGADVQPGRCEDCGLHVWLWLCVRYDDDGERHQPRCDECKAAAVAFLTNLAAETAPASTSSSDGVDGSAADGARSPA